MVTIFNIIYKPTQKIIKSSNILYIYDFGFMKGFLINNDFKLYKILHKEMKESSLYEKCELMEKNIPLDTFSIDKYEYIEENNILYINNYSIEFKQQLENSSYPISVINDSSLSFPPLPLLQQELKEYSHEDLPLYQEHPLPLEQQGLFDQSLLKHLHKTSKKEMVNKNISTILSEHKPSIQKSLSLQHLSSRMIPLSQLTVRQQRSP